MAVEGTQIGVKFDAGKPRIGLVPPYALESVAAVLTYALKKYAAHNWKYVEGAEHRYLDAAMRHIVAYMRGEMNDQEDDLPHLSHAICCLMFLIDLRMDPEIVKRRNPTAKTEDAIGITQITQIPWTLRTSEERYTLLNG